MRAVDTNVVVRLIARDDIAQAEIAEAFSADGGWVSCLVLAETVWVLESVYGLGRKQIATAVGMLLEHQQLSLENPGVVRHALADYETHRAVGFTDCLVVALARSAGHTPVGTFDKRLARLPDTYALSR